MNKSNNRLKRLSVLFALSCAAFGSSAAETVVIGPVEKIASRAPEITVLGQTFLTSGAAQAKGLDIGAYVVVTAARDQRGALVVKSLKVLDDAYVAGASQIYLQGTIDRYSSITGLAQIGGLKILLSEALAARPSVSFSAGDAIELVGTQAGSGAPVWASAVQAIQGTGTQAIQGTGALAIQGTGSLAIQGTGSLSIQGTGTQAIQGTGKQAIQGTGKQAIQGTGALAIQGTGKQAIQGTGKQAIQGTGALAIQGTGKQAIQGTGKQAIQGTGALAIQGTGIN